MIYRVCNLGHALKPSSHYAGLEHIRFAGSNFGTEGARGRHANDVQLKNAFFHLQVPQQAIAIQGQKPLTASELASAQPQEQKQMLGERLFPLISQMFPDLAGKITGMLLEIDNSELLHMLEYHESLTSKVRIRYITGYSQFCLTNGLFN